MFRATLLFGLVPALTLLAGPAPGGAVEAAPVASPIARESEGPVGPGPIGGTLHPTAGEVPALLAQNEEDAAGIAGVMAMLFCYGVFFLLMLAIGIFILYLLYQLAAAVPEPYQVMKPNMVFLMLIPFFNIVWQFFVYTQIPQGYRNWLASRGVRYNPEDCHEQFGLWSCIIGLIPCANIAQPVLIILWFVKMFELKKYAQTLGPQTGGGYAVGYPVGGLPGAPGSSPFPAQGNPYK